MCLLSVLAKLVLCTTATPSANARVCLAASQVDKVDAGDGSSVGTDGTEGGSLLFDGHQCDP